MHEERIQVVRHRDDCSCGSRHRSGSTFLRPSAGFNRYRVQGEDPVLGVFVSKRDPQSILGTDLSADDLAVLRFVDARVDRGSQEVTAHLLGFAERKAVFREGQGCAVVHREAGKPAPRHARGPADPLRGQPPLVDELGVDAARPSDVDQARLHAVLEQAFSEPDPALPRRTRAVVVVHKGRLVAERYAQGYSEGHRSHRLVDDQERHQCARRHPGEGREDRSRRPGADRRVARPSRPRRNITGAAPALSSGLQFDENYTNPLADVTYMLLGVADAAAYALAKPLQAEPGARWSYSSGTTNIIARAMRQRIGPSDYSEFPRRALFERTGMTSAVIETDAAGTFVGSSFMYATARDWARFGLLYLRDGAGSRPANPAGGLGGLHADAGPERSQPAVRRAHFWLSIPKEYRCGKDSGPLPADAFHAIGHEGSSSPSFRPGTGAGPASDFTVPLRLGSPGVRSVDLESRRRMAGSGFTVRSLPSVAPECSNRGSRFQADAWP